MKGIKAEIVKSELLHRLEQSHSDILETFTSLIDAASWMIVNHSSIPPLFKRLQRPDSPEVTAVAARYLSLIAKECAPMFKSHVSELVIVMADKRNDKLVEVALQALAEVCKADKECGPDDRCVLPESIKSIAHRPDSRTVERAIKMVRQGTPRHAKFAARFLSHCKHTDACSELIEVRCLDHSWSTLTCPSVHLGRLCQS